LELESEDRGRLGLWDISPRRHSTSRTYRSRMTHSPQQADEILSSASGWIHHWPVRWR
jgi:hypothetical protein